MAVHGTESRFQDMALKVDSLVLNEVAVTATAAELNAVAGSGVSAAEFAVLDGATAGVALPNKVMITNATNGIDDFRDIRAPAIYQMTQIVAVNATGTIGGSVILGNAILTSTTAAAVVATLTAVATDEAALIARFPNIQPNDTWQFSVVNTGPNTFTLATAAGWTDGGNAFTAVAAGASARFAVRRVSASAWTIFRVG